MNEDEEIISKSQRKRDSHALQKLAERLVQMPAATLATLPLPEQLREAIEDTHKMQQRGALRRQKQYLGKIMRAVDAEPIQAAVTALEEKERLRAAQFHHVEALRDRLIDGGDEALTALLAEFPQADRQHLRQLQRKARAEREAAKPPRAARLLFTYLRDLVEQD